jgi:8-oxo-dGTP pyrophosphatase MutT (NUDIX family)
LKKSSKKTISIHFYKKNYPNVKIKVLKKSKFFQIQPGPLSYANNLYRFGVSSNDSDFCDKVLSSVENYSANHELVQTYNLNDIDENFFEFKALGELCLWLLENGVNEHKLRQHFQEVNLRVKEVVGYKWLVNITEAIEHARSKASNYFEIARISPLHLDDKMNSENGEKGIFFRKMHNGEIAHTTVALLLARNDSLLLIRKSDPFYNNELSILAGHLEFGESINDAIAREIREEIGIRLNSLDFLLKMENVRDKCRYAGFLHDWYVFHTTEHILLDSLSIEKNEILNVEWIEISKLETLKDQLTYGCRELFKVLGYIK